MSPNSYIFNVQAAAVAVPVDEVELGAAAAVLNAGHPADEMRLEALSPSTVFVRQDGLDGPLTGLTFGIPFRSQLCSV